MNPRHRFQLAPLLILLFASALRFHALSRDVRFHPDEALFASFARSAAVQGDWMLHGPLDKPPLTIYADAFSMMFFGVTPLPNGVLTLNVHAGEFAARIPGTFASILLVAVMYALAKRLNSYQLPAQDRKATYWQVATNNLSLSPSLLAMLLAALSPYALAFSATAFTDGLMLLFLTLSLWAASRRKAFQTGVWLALAFGCKQQALFYIPLALAILYSAQLRRTWHRFFKLITHYSLLITLLPILIGVALLFIWDGARGQTTSLWALAVANNAPGHLARLDELLPRLATWGMYAQFLFGTTALTILFALVALAYPLKRLFSSRWQITGDLILFAYVVLYFLLNWLIAFNIYDRYLLLLLPPLWLLSARGINHLSQRLRESEVQRKYVPSVTLTLCCSVLILFSIFAVNGDLPIGGDHGENAGIDQLGAYLDSKPLGAIIYDHWLGWELGYYLGTWSDKRRVYYPTPQALVADALLQPDPAPRYFAAPDDAPFQSWLDALHASGFAVSQVYDQPPFVVYELIPPRRGGCVSAVESSSPGQTESFADSCG